MRSARIQSCLSRLASAFVSRACGLDGADGVCPAVEEFQRVLGAGAGFGAVGEEGQPGVSGEVEPALAELADGGMVEALGTVLWKRTLWVDERVRNVSLWVASSPTSSERSRLRGSRPAAERRMATASVATRSHSL